MWERYYQKDEAIAILDVDGDLVLAPISTFSSQTSEDDFKNGEFSLITVVGAEEGADIVLACKKVAGSCYRKPIKILNSASLLRDYQILITVDTASLISGKKLQSDCGDLRFVDSDGETFLSYWLESGCNTKSTRIWVKVPYLPSGYKTIYLYYGNPSVDSLSNPEDTFLAFDWKLDGPLGARRSVSEEHTCALVYDGRVRCWGRNDYNQLGDATIRNKLSPVTVPNISDVVGVAAGRFHTCVLISGGTVKCWGDNRFGQLGNANRIPLPNPVSVSELFNIKTITAGAFHTCALLSTTGQVKCWGSNGSGRLGDGTITERTRPIMVSNLTWGVDIAAGGAHTCALLSNGQVKCWGNNGYGQLGDGSQTDKTVPSDVFNLNEAVAIGASYFHTCALLSNGQVKCWGSNEFYQLGNDSKNNSNTPVTVSNINNAVSIAVGGWHTCALISDGTVKCWGVNIFGELGDGTEEERTTPVLVSGLNNVVAIGAGNSHTCALISDGTVKCWGINTHGQLGDGTTLRKNTPVLVSGFNLGGRYEKSGGIYSVFDPNSDLYFVREFAFAEPTVIVGKEETSYHSSGTFISSVQDLGSLLELTDFSWTSSTPPSTSIKFQVSSSVDNSNWTDFSGPDGNVSTYYTTSGTPLWSEYKNPRYLKYKLYLETTDTSQTPRLHDIKIGYKRYPELASLVSSPYNSNDPDNILNKIQWSESVILGVTDIKFQLRTAPDLSGKPGSWTSWMGPDGTNNSYFSDTSGGEKMPQAIFDGKNDQWIQYKAFLFTKDGSETPVLSEVSLEYLIKKEE